MMFLFFLMEDLLDSIVIGMLAILVNLKHLTF
ncbi:hypothetical protein GGI1_02907 [Acidithiobacillus sp. GGI-221]|nr:hypothetical protein GGI1_02907 [Acidithiobacillus sp. GGI-221]